MLNILSTGAEEAGIHSLCLDSLKKAGQFTTSVFPRFKTMIGTVIVATLFKCFVSCALDVAFHVSWFPNSLGFIISKNLGNSKLFNRRLYSLL